MPSVWYESPHRIADALADLAAVAPGVRVFLVREFTKLHEQQVAGTPAEVAAALPDPMLGEVSFVIDAGVAEAGEERATGGRSTIGSTRCWQPAPRRPPSQSGWRQAAPASATPSTLASERAAAKVPARRARERPTRDPAQLLRYHADLLHHGHAAHRARVHDDRGGHSRAHGPGVGRRRALADRHRRARAKGRASRAAAGETPQAYVDELAPKWRALAPAFDAQFSDFIRTTEPRHRDACLALFEKMRANGDVYEGTYEGWYCTNDETFWPEAKLIDGRCPNPECRREVQWLSEHNWFFKLSAYTARLIEHFTANPEFVRPQSAYNEMMRTLEGGLEDLSISRSTIDWGIPLPGGGVLYVWFDALINYISALGYPDESGLMARYWPATHLIGKEIARFHTLIWPAMLWSAALAAPERIFAHGWLLTDGEKMSKSIGNVVEPFALVEQFGADAVRYFLFREAPFGSDFSISVEKLRMRHNSDLGNDLGNLLRRSLAMLAKYRNGLVPERGRIATRRALRRHRRPGSRARDGDALSRGARYDLGVDHRAQSRDRRPQTLGALQTRARRGTRRAALRSLRRACASRRY